MTLSILFSILNIWSYSWGRNDNHSRDNAIPAQSMSTPNAVSQSEPSTPNAVSQSEPESSSAIVPASADYYIGMNFSSVDSQLRNAGFTNLSYVEVGDLVSSESPDLNKVTEVSINGVTTFSAKTVYDKEAEIILSYHSVKKAPVPFSTDDLQSFSYEELVEMLLEAGFLNIETNTVDDLDPETMKMDNLNTVTVRGNNIFTKGQEVAVDSKIVVTCHIPFILHDVLIHIDFLSNLFFSRYDVDVALNNEKQCTLEHGEDKDISLKLKEGSYVLSFSDEESPSVDGTVTLDVKDDLEAEFQIDCTSDNVNVRTIYVEYKHAAGENEVMMPHPSSYYRNMNFQDVVAAFQSAGFKSITTEILYDIYWGWTSEGATDSVSIDGIRDFNRGDVFSKDASVIVTYHLKEEDDPAKQTEAPVDTPDSTEKIETEFDYHPSDSPYYSSNTLDKVKNGNTGVYAYKNRGGSYSIYYIIDFDEGYVYRFLDGNGDSSCDRIKIVSGTLNDVVIITYHDGVYTWSEGIHFKYKNNPDHLILEDNDHFEWDFYPTSLSDALAIRAKKEIHNY